jgi:hypothetical protein
MRIWSLFLAATFAAAGCARVEYVPTSPPPRAIRARPAAEVEVLQTRTQSRPYVEVGHLDVQAQTNDPEFLIDQLREEAGERGCDAIFFVGESPKGYRALCIVYRDPR